MKKIIITGVVALFSVGLISAQEMKNLPKNSQKAIKSHFSALTVDKINIDEDEMDEMYQVKFTDGTIIEFNKKGKPTEVSSEKEVPEALLPRKIKLFLNNKYEGAKVTEWEFDDNKHEINLEDGTELIFNKKGKFVSKE